MDKDIFHFPSKDTTEKLKNLLIFNGLLFGDKKRRVIRSTKRQDVQ